MHNLPPEFLERLQAITNKRAQVVIDHILRHGFITTEDLTNIYGYSHPPRAVMDVRDEGIPIERFKVKNAKGRTIAAYRFPQNLTLEISKTGGRKPLSKKLRNQLFEQAGYRCSVCSQTYEPRFLQVDHRIPYAVLGDVTDTANLADYMPLCRSCNRAKSWACEHCYNWHEIKDPNLCKTCSWGSPQTYQHIALQPIRRTELVWTGDETAVYEQLQQLAEQRGISLADYLKAVLEQHLGKDV